MNEIHECGDLRALEVKDATGGIYNALRELDSDLSEAKDQEILSALRKLELDTVNDSFFDLKEGQYVLYNQGAQSLEVVNDFDPSCQVSYEPLIPPAGRPRPIVETGSTSSLGNMPFPHLVAFPEMRVSRARNAIRAQRDKRPDIKDFCAKFSGYNFYYITGQEGVLSQDAWTFIPYLVKEGIGTEISNGDQFVQARNGRIQPPSFESPHYQEHLREYLEAIESDPNPKAVGLHFARTEYGGHIIEERSKNRNADLNSHSAVALPGESVSLQVRGTLKQTLNREYATNGARIDWSNPLLARIKVKLPGEDELYPLPEVLNRGNLGQVTIHDTFIEESFGPDFRKRSLTLTLLTKQGSVPLFTAVSAAKLNDEYQSYFSDPVVNELNQTNFEFHSYRRGESLAEITTQKLPEVAPYGEDYYKLQQIYYWMFNVRPQALKNGQKIPLLTSKEDIDKYFDIMVQSLGHTHLVIDIEPPETIQAALTRIVGSSLSASAKEIAYFFEQNPEVAESVLALIRGSDPQSYMGQIINEAGELSQALTLKSLFFLSRSKQNEIRKLVQTSYAKHKNNQESIFEDYGVKIPENFPYSYQFLQAVAPNPRDQMTLVAIWKNESGSESWWKSKLFLSRRQLARIADNIGIRDEVSTGEMQVQEPIFRQSFELIARRTKDFPRLYTECEDIFDQIRQAIKEKKPVEEIDELIEDLLLKSREISLIAAQVINQKNIPVARNIAQLTGTNWEHSAIHQARILANIYNANPVEARVIEDYNRWILMAESLGVLSEKEDQPPSRIKPGFVEGEYQVEKATLSGGPELIKYHSKNLDSELFKETIKRVINFISENWASDNPAIAKIREKMSLFQFNERAENLLKVVEEEKVSSFLSRSSRPGNPPIHPRYQLLAKQLQEALAIDMSQLPLEAYNKVDPSQAILKGNYGVRGLNALLD